MHSTQLLSALALALSAFSVAHAAVPDVNVQAAMEHHLAKRQSGTVSASASAPASSSASRPSPSSSSKTTPPATTTPPSTTPQSSTTAQATPPSTSNTPPPPTSSSTVPSETSAHQATPTNTDKTPTETTSSSLPPRTTSTFTTTFVSTDPANGQVATVTSEGTTVQTSGLASNNNDNNAPPSGLSVQNRNIIIGCVVGVGGAIILAVVGVVAWRVWGRKRNEETDGAFGTTYNPVEKPEQPGSQSSRTPFQSTLESYHAPTQVNTASNF